MIAKQREVASIHPAVSVRIHVAMAGCRIAAGFPSPADDYLEAPLDLGERLIQNPAATFLVRVAGNSMTGAGITPGDLLVVDRSLDANDGSIVIAAVNGEFTVKRLRRQTGGAVLVAENPDYPPIVLAEGDEMSVWGVVRHVIKDV